MKSREDEHVGLDEPMTPREMFDYFERIVDQMSDKYCEGLKSAMRTLTIINLFWVILFAIYFLSR